MSLRVSPLVTEYIDAAVEHLAALRNELTHAGEPSPEDEANSQEAQAAVIRAKMLLDPKFAASQAETARLLDETIARDRRRAHRMACPVGVCPMWKVKSRISSGALASDRRPDSGARCLRSARYQSPAGP